MRWATAGARGAVLGDLLDRVTGRVQADLDGAAADLVLVFVTPHHMLSVGEALTRVADRFPGARVVGCTASGVIGGGHEFEDDAAVSMTAAWLPDVEIRPFRLGPEIVRRNDPIDEAAVAAAVGLPVGAAPALLLLTDPFSCSGEELVRALDRAWPLGVKVGGLVSGARAPRGSRLLVDRTLYDDGAVGVALQGAVTVETVVAQGCRPVGAPLRVTRMADRLVAQLDGRPASEALQEAWQALAGRDRELFQRGPLIGVAMTHEATGWRRGDFLVRPLLGIDPGKQAVAVGHRLFEGDVLQLHVRDAATSAEELHELVARYARQVGPVGPAGAVLFSCVGRGAGLYGQPHHDSRVLKELLNDVPIGGFFGDGEIGPVHGRTFLHGFTSAVALFRAVDWN